MSLWDSILRRRDIPRDFVRTMPSDVNFSDNDTDEVIVGDPNKPLPEVESVRRHPVVFTNGYSN
ncbi:hypothetical protein HY405_00385 [Candidatus Microgenomates bacterium]|nr:hypothetical protein [Candidatus Microgenomates bacterium]